MINIKKSLTVGAIFAILLIAFFVTTVMKNKVIEKNANNKDRLHGSYLIQNENLGFKFNISDEFFSGYQEEQQGYITNYYLPTKDSEWGQKYAKVLTIAAVPKTEAKQKEQICKDGSTAVAETPFDCIAFDNPIGENKYFIFATIPLIEAGPTDLQEKGVYDGIDEALKQATFSDPESMPKNLVYQNLTAGYELNYPSNLDRVFFDRANLEKLNAEITLPTQLGAESNHFADKEIFITLPVQYCALSGKCSPTTTNFAINFGPTGMTLKELQQSGLAKSLIKKNLGSEEYGTDKIYTYEEGAEGEGVIYNFLVSGDNKVYSVALKYLDEQVIPKYKTTKGFTSFTQQKAIFEDIVKNVRFQTPLNELN